MLSERLFGSPLGSLGHLQLATRWPDSCPSQLRQLAHTGWASAADGPGSPQPLPEDPSGQEGAKSRWPSLRPGVTLLLPQSPGQSKSEHQPRFKEGAMKSSMERLWKTGRGSICGHCKKKSTKGCYKKNHLNCKGHNFCTEDTYIPKMRYLFKYKHMKITLL